jgi:hypothetical protein
MEKKHMTDRQKYLLTYTFYYALKELQSFLDNYKQYTTPEVIKQKEEELEEIKEAIRVQGYEKSVKDFEKQYALWQKFGGAQ